MVIKFYQVYYIGRTYWTLGHYWHHYYNTTQQLYQGYRVVTEVYTIPLLSQGYRNYNPVVSPDYVYKV